MCTDHEVVRGFAETVQKGLPSIFVACSVCDSKVSLATPDSSLSAPLGPVWTTMFVLYFRIYCRFSVLTVSPILSKAFAGAVSAGLSFSVGVL